MTRINKYIKNDDSPIITVTGVTHWFRILNKNIFNNLLPNPIIVVRKLRGAYGLCLDGKKITITIHSGIINKKLYIETILHEMVHIHQINNNIELGHGRDFKKWKVFCKKEFNLIL